MAPRSIPSIPLMRIPINALAFLILSWAFTGVVLTADPQPPATNAISHLARLTPLKSPDGQYRLAMGDRVSYRVIEDKEEAKSLVVTDSGELDVPYLGRVKAVGALKTTWHWSPHPGHARLARTTSFEKSGGSAGGSPRCEYEGPGSIISCTATKERP